MQETTTATAPSFTPHALDQAASRALPVEALALILSQELDGVDLNGRDAAVYITKTRERGGLVGSNGDQIWCVVRDGAVTTVMLRRSDQPSTKQALRVDLVLGASRMGR